MHNFLHIDLRARIYLFTHYIRFFKRGKKQSICIRRPQTLFAYILSLMSQKRKQKICIKTKQFYSPGHTKLKIFYLTRNFGNEHHRHIFCRYGLTIEVFQEFLLKFDILGNLFHLKSEFLEIS